MENKDYIEGLAVAKKTIKSLQSQRDRLREGLNRIIGLCGEPTITKCKCGRPTGLGAIVACARNLISEIEGKEG